MINLGIQAEEVALRRLEVVQEDLEQTYFDENDNFCITTIKHPTFVNQNTQSLVVMSERLLKIRPISNENVVIKSILNYEKGGCK